MPEIEDILIEQRRCGNALRITAVCAVTGLEVVFIAPLQAGKATIDALAASKLALARRRAGEASESTPMSDPAGPSRSRRGVEA